MRKWMVTGLLLAAFLPLGAQAKVVLGPDVEVQLLAPGVWWHVTYQTMAPWGKVAANGLLVLDRSRSHGVLIDTPWTPEQTAVLLDWVEKSLEAKVETVVVCHSHADCLGGLPEIHRRGIPSIGLDRTRELARAAGVEAPRQGFAGVRRLMAGGRELELFHPGPGHTVDNIVVWLADQRVLFGGCLLKPADASSLGNTAEADVTAWPATVRAVGERYRTLRLVVPGHGAPGGPELLGHTLALLAGHAR